MTTWIVIDTRAASGPSIGDAGDREWDRRDRDGQDADSDAGREHDEWRRPTYGRTARNAPFDALRPRRPR